MDGALAGADAVVALVFLEWTTGWMAAAAWTQSWAVVTRGHFRIMGWGAAILAVLAVIVARATGVAAHTFLLVEVLAGAAVLFLASQYVRSDVAGVVTGAMGTFVGVAALGAAASQVHDWPLALAGLHLIAGAALLGGIANGMMLGHWYLNQPGLKPWALGRLTDLSLVAVAVSALLGFVGVAKLARAETGGAVLGLPGFGESFGIVFYVAWVALIAFTGVVVWMARRCVAIRSIQSATGLYYVAVLTGGVSVFVVRYLMVNAS